MSQSTPNRLSNEKSPYLLQHANNPVDWFPWSPEAFDKAKTEDKPIFLSIGYATCHWCHVMEKESFEDSEVAEYLNEHFVSIKVDREERPEIDSVYMRVCQMLTGGGGWPLTIVMTADKQAFFAGTYFPKSRKMQRPGLMELLPRIVDMWHKERDQILDSAQEITLSLQKDAESFFGEDLTPAILHTAFLELEKRFDAENGGFGNAPKFPSPHNLTFLLRYAHYFGNEKAEEMVVRTLDKMRSGGIYDHLGFGFHRYSTDKEWLLPHFEKMLYDQAMLLLSYAELYHKTKEKKYLSVIDEIVQYLIRDMRSPDGAFYSAEDADSEGVEGKFYLWTKTEIEELLGADAKLFCAVYNIKDEGNYIDPQHDGVTGENILKTTLTARDLSKDFDLTIGEIVTSLQRSRDTLFAVRSKRVRPALDDKIVTDWNGLIIAALAYAGNVTNSATYIQAAEDAAACVLDKLLKNDTQLLHRYRDGDAAFDGTLEDYAFMTWGLLELYQATFKNIYLIRAVGFTEHVLEHFVDTITGGYYFTADYAEELLARQKEVYDGAIPSGNSVMLSNLIRLGRLTSKTNYLEEAAMIIRAFSDIVKQSPSAFSSFLGGVMLTLVPFHEVVILAERDAVNTKRSLREFISQYNPGLTLLLRGFVEESSVMDVLAPHTVEMKPLNSAPTYFVCQNFECAEPTTDVEVALATIRGEATE